MADIIQSGDPVTDKVTFRAVTKTAETWMCDGWGEKEIELDQEDAQAFLDQAAENGFGIELL